MRNNILSLVARAIYLIVFSQSFILLAAAAAPASFWQPHPPSRRADQRQTDRWARTSDRLLEQINKQIAKASTG